MKGCNVNENNRSTKRVLSFSKTVVFSRHSEFQYYGAVLTTRIHFLSFKFPFGKYFLPDDGYSTNIDRNTFFSAKKFDSRQKKNEHHCQTNDIFPSLGI